MDRRFDSVFGGSSREVDADGFLRLPVRVIGLGKLVYQDGEEWVHEDALADPEFLKTVEGKPIVRDEHQWKSPEDMAGVIGNFCGVPELADGFVVCDALITDRRAIEDIQSGELCETSMGYRADVGEDGVQRNLRANHLVICGRGKARGGRDMKVGNTKTTGADDMKLKFNGEDLDLSGGKPKDGEVVKEKEEAVINIEGDGLQAELSERLTALEARLAALEAAAGGKKAKDEEEAKADKALDDKDVADVEEAATTQDGDEVAVEETFEDEEDLQNLRGNLAKSKRVIDRRYNLADYVAGKLGAAKPANLREANALMAGFRATYMAHRKRQWVEDGTDAAAKRGNAGKSAFDRLVNSWKKG